MKSNNNGKWVIEHGFQTCEAYLKILNRFIKTNTFDDFWKLNDFHPNHCHDCKRKTRLKYAQLLKTKLPETYQKWSNRDILKIVDEVETKLKKEEK